MARLSIVDSHRWFGFDLFCAWQDVYLMSLMFLLSGLFVWPSLGARKLAFCARSFAELGFPYSLALSFCSDRDLSGLPLDRRTERAGLFARILVAAVRHNGQLWFLWQLLALNFVAVGVNWPRRTRSRAWAGGWLLVGVPAFSSSLWWRFPRVPMSRWRSRSRPGNGPIRDRLPCSGPGRCSMPSSSSPAWASGSKASIAALWRPMGRWPGDGCSGLRRPLRCFSGWA